MIPNPLFIHVRGTGAFGGSLRTGKRKTARPLSTHYPIRVVFKVRDYHTSHCLLRSENAQRIRRLLKSEAVTAGVRIEQINIKPFALQLKIKGKSREGLKHFFRVFTAFAAKKIRRIKERKYKFWGQQIFTQILNVPWIKEKPTVVISARQGPKYEKQDQLAPP